MSAEPLVEPGQQPFVHLHVHTEYSLLDGLSKIDKLVAHAKELGMSSLAISDHGAMHGVVSFYRACKNAGIKPIIGMEGYLAKKDMRIHDQTEKSPYHLLLLARNEIGYKNLLSIASAAQLEGFYMRPRIDRDFLAAHAEGLICTSGCLAAEIPRLIEDGKDDEALRTIGLYQDMFGKDNFFLELQHHEIPQLRALNNWLYEHRDHANVPLLATNDVHYVRYEDYDAHDTLLCIQTGAHKSEEKRMRMADPSYYLRSPMEMWDLFSDVPEALKNTVEVAVRCDVSAFFEQKGYHLPIFPVPSGYDEETYLRHLAERGLRWRYGEKADLPLYQDRLNYELGVIHKMGFDTYFLIVWDLCQFARFADIWWNVRGSGAGSVTAYSLGITNIDPIANNLIFERFLNPGRVSMPDIDMDFPDDRRMEMIDYASHKYGTDKVAAIITFGTLKARAAIKDVGRVLDYPLSEVNSLTQLVPQIPSRPVTLSDCLGDDEDKAVPELKQLYAGDDRIRKLLDTARTVEGVARNAGTHAAGIIIGDKPLVEYLPLHRPIGDTTVSQVTQFPMEICESIGLLKVDFLGLSTLTIMRKACELIEKYSGVRYSMDNIPYRPDPNDPEVTRRVEALFELMGRGETTGVFQLESDGMKKMLVQMKPKTFEHVIAAISLYRPGPMSLIPTYIKRMHGEEKVSYHHSKLESILNETYSIIVYQEQIQQIAAQLFGYSLGDADLMRRAVSKKKKKDLDQHKAIFMERGPQYGVNSEVAEKIFGEIEFFAAYGFNKSHAADYAVLTCQTAYLKAHYPEEYYTALLSVQRDVIADVATFTSDCRRFGIPILPPNVNGSDLDFTIEERSDGKRCIRYGLAAIKNAGEKALQFILDARNAGGPFRNTTDFCRRVDLRQVGKRAIESLIKAGAFDVLAEQEPDRDALLLALDRLLKYSGDHHHAKEIGQISLFGDSGIGDDLTLPTVPDDKKSDKRERLKWEKDLIGLYVSPHPLTDIADHIQHVPNIQFSDTLRRDSDSLHDRPVTVVGLVVGIRNITTKNNDAMAIVSLEDITGNVDCVFFPRTWRKYEEIIVPETVIVVRGKADTSRGDVQVIAENASTNVDVSWAADSPDARPSSRAAYAPPVYTPADDASSSFADTDTAPPDEDPGYVPLDDDEPPENDFPAVPPTNGNGYRKSMTPEPPTSELPPQIEQTIPQANGYEAPPEEEHTDRSHPPQMITIVIRLGEDSKRDRTRLEKLKNELTQYPGQDRFRFVLDDSIRTQKIYTIDFPDDTTCYDQIVIQLLNGKIKKKLVHSYKADPLLQPDEQGQE